MTETKLAARTPVGPRAKTLVALLAATAALAGGTQAFAPATAAAMIGDGEECGEPTVDCEPGGGAGGSGGGPGDTIGSETIVIRDTAPSSLPSPCARASSCLPSQLGGGRPGSSGGRNPRPRHGAKPVGVGEAPKGKSRQLTNEECARLVTGKLVLPKEQRARDLSALHSSLASTRASFLKMQMNLGNVINHLKGQLKALQSKGDADDGQILALEGQLAGLTREYASLESKATYFDDWAITVRQQLEHLDPEARTENLAQRKKCSARNGSKP
jgi:hypothetical protein